MTFAVAWSDTPGLISWSPTGVIESTLTANRTLQSVKATVPTAPSIPTRFIRLKGTSP